MRVAAAEVNRAIGDGRGGLNADLIEDLRVLTRLELPFLLAGFRVEGVEVAVPTTDIDNPRGNGRGGMHHPVRVKFPLQPPRLGLECVNVAVAAAEVHPAVRERRRGEIEIPGVGNRLLVRGDAVQALGLEAAFACGFELPELLAGLRVERVEAAVAAQKVNSLGRDRGAGIDCPGFGFEMPFLGSRGGVERVKVAVVAAHVHDARVDGRRGKHVAAGFELPLHSCEIGKA